MLYEIKLADGDRTIYESDMTLDELKQYIANNDFIEIPRSGSIPYGHGGFRSVPMLGSYKTSSIVYINHDIKLEHCAEHNNKIIESSKPYVDEINKYEINRRMKWWLFWHTWDELDEDGLPFYTIDKLEEIIRKMKKYKCKIKMI